MLRPILLTVTVALLALPACGKEKSGKKAPGARASKDVGKKEVAKKRPVHRKPGFFPDAKARPKDKGSLSAWMPGFSSSRWLKMNDDVTVDIRWFGTPGAKLSVAGKTATFDDKGIAATRVDLTPAMFEALKKWKHTQEWYNRIDLKLDLPVTITAPSGEVTKAVLKTEGDQVLATYFVATLMKGKPAKAPWESDKRAKKKTYFTLYPDKMHLHIKPKDRGWVDADGVVISEYLGSDRKLCGTYRGTKTGRKTEVHISLVKRRVTVYDRRTGKKRGSKEFKGSGRCPRKLSKSYKVYYPSDKAMAQFIKRQIR